MRRFASLFMVSVTFLAHLNQVLAFSQYASLAGLSHEQLEKIIPTLQIRHPAPPPEPQVNISARLVADDAHPFIPPGPGDIRGPCPGLNTLANHGYIPRNGIASPKQLIQAAEEGFNLGYDIARFLVYVAHLSDGNLLTDLLSIGKSTPATGEDAPDAPVAGGLSMHGTFEGDASLTRGDSYWGDNYSFNETLFQDMFMGHDHYNPIIAAEYRIKRWRDCKATNPNFTYTDIRFATAYAESVLAYTAFPKTFLGIPSPILDKETARSFFQLGKFPEGFHRRALPAMLVEIGAQVVIMQAASVGILPGRNVGSVNNYIPDQSSPINDILYCKLYENFVNKIVVQKLYPNPTTPALLTALRVNLRYMYSALGLLGVVCPELFPYGH